MDLPDQMDIRNLDYPPIITLIVVNNKHQPSQNRTRCTLKVNGFTRRIEISIGLELVQRPQVNSLPFHHRTKLIGNIYNRL